MPIRSYRTPSGKKKYQADYRNSRRGVGRVKRSFDTYKKAEDWLAAVHLEAHERFTGKRERHTFGEALARYLTDESLRKESHQDDKYNAQALRCPIWDGRRWLYLEETNLEETNPVMAIWLHEQYQVKRRRYLDQEIYLQRQDASGTLTWYWQPNPSEGERPRPRVPVKEKALLQRLDAPGGRGPYSRDTLRIRQVLVKHILGIAWRRWDWLGQDIGGKIELESPSAGREIFLTEIQLQALIEAAASARLPNKEVDPRAPHFADAIRGAAMIGWRRSNTLQLDWSRVVFPVYAEDADGQRHLVQIGYIWVEGKETKNKDFLAQPISDELLELLQRRWELRMTFDEKTEGGKATHWNLVFHDGTGRPFGDFRRRWKTAKRVAGVDQAFRWHDLRHTWASHLAQRGVTDRHIQELGGWKDKKMVNRYSKLLVDHLLDAVNKPKLTVPSRQS